MIKKKFTLFFSILIAITFSCRKNDEKNQEKTHLSFSEVDQTISRVSFNNLITESDTLNYYTYPYAYLGGGVSVGDVTNDGLIDIFFTGNMVDNKLYINQGDFSFKDTTTEAKLAGDKRWYTGSTMVDINTDGWLDIYICVSGKTGNRKNQLFVNNQNGTFTESAEKYGLADKSNSIQATFFDYDNDGDLDCFIANYPNEPVSMGNEFYKEKIDENLWENSGHLYQNNDGKFMDITEKSGLQKYGLSLGVIASDFNNNGRQDLYISNDFNVSDYLFINNGNGTFSEIIKKGTNNTSMFGMGIDAADFNNDGLTDLMQLDMTSGDHVKSKTNMASMRPETFYEAVDLGLHYQYMQNSLQLNRGNKKDGNPYFSNIARFAGIATTDWSWGTLFADFDNDGNKDIVVSNGIKRDVNNNDVLASYKEQSFFGEAELNYKELPQTPVSNFIFKNNGNLSFSDETESSGFNKKGFSNGIAYADFNNDGALDLVINNVDAPASLYKNEGAATSNYLQLAFAGSEKNKFGIGCKVTIETKNNKKQSQELTLTRGYQSSVAPILHFGLNKIEKVNLKVTWHDGKIQQLNSVEANKLITLNHKDAVEVEKQTDKKNRVIFNEITEEVGINFQHKEDAYNDFKHEPLLPHKNSQQGPALAVGDMNNDGLEDVFVGGAKGQKPQLFIQTKQGKFKYKYGIWEEDYEQEDTGALLKDFDNDGDLDLYVVSGGNDINISENYFQDRLYVNNNGDFEKINLPKISCSGRSIAAADTDNNGTLDLFIGGRVSPGNYPHPPQSYLLKNNGKKDRELNFYDQTTELIPQIKNTGMITDAIWSDFDNDSDLDLIVVGEWMPIQIYVNTNGKFKLENDNLKLKNTRGWWNTIKAFDIDNDGDQDYLVGNLGLNYKYKTSQSAPFEIFANDFDENRTQDIVLSYEKEGKKYPLRGMQCSSEQVPAIAKRFKTYKEFATSSLEDIYGEYPLQKALHYQVDLFENIWIENIKGKFKIHKLPNQVQLSSINTIVSLKEKGFLLAGNLFNSEVETPRNDAGVGVMLSKNLSATLSTSGLFLNKEVKKILPITINGRKSSFIVANNNAALQVIEITLNKI